MKPLRSTYPESHLCNPAFRYVPAASTDIRETIRRARLRQERREYVGEFAELVQAARMSDFVRVD